MQFAVECERRKGIDATLLDLVPGFMACIGRKVQIFLLLASRIASRLEAKLRRFTAYWLLETGY